MPALVFIGGISGVGKTTLLAQIPGRNRSWQWCSAGTIIAEELALPALPTSDTATVMRYQRALVQGYQRHARATRGPIVMDGHYTLPVGAAQLAIPPEIFRELAPQVLVLLSAPSPAIRQRRACRDGDAPDEVVVADAIDAEERAARAVASELQIPLHCWPAEPATVQPLTQLIEELRA